MIYFNNDNSDEYLNQLYELLIKVLLEENYDNSLFKGIDRDADSFSTEKKSN